MKDRELFETFSCKGKLLLPDKAQPFDELRWCAHPAFEGVELKHLITASQTQGEFSYHLVRLAPGHKIGTHVHQTQLETHEVIAGKGVCINDGIRLLYEPGVLSIFQRNRPHEVTAGEEGLYLFAKFIPALV